MKIPRHTFGKNHASVLVGLLWCLALLSIVVIGTLHTSRIDLMIEKNYGDRIQAHYLALAGVEKTKALLYRDAQQRARSGRNHTGELYNSPDNFRDVRFGRGQFSIIRDGTEAEGGGIIYGISDEESRLNLNSASFEQVSNLDRMTPDVAAAIIDWRDEDNQPSPGGAESDYYASLRPPYLTRNAPFQTIRELLLVRGVSPELLFGTRRGEVHHVGDGEAGPASGQSGSGWADVLTVNSSVDNVSAAGEDQVNIQTADETALTSIPGITSDIARAIVAYRNQNRFESIVDLLDVTAAQNRGNPGPQAGNPGAQNFTVPQGQFPQQGQTPGQPASNPSGPKVIGEQLLMDIADELTAQSGSELRGAINVNTASFEVLIGLPGMTRQLAYSIISYRQSSGFFPNIAYLLHVPGMSSQLLKQIAPLLSVRSETFRILSEGKIASSKVTQRIQEIVHIGLHSVTTVSYREDDL